jgi:hypothetical protein
MLLRTGELGSLSMRLQQIRIFVVGHMLDYPQSIVSYKKLGMAKHTPIVSFHRHFHDIPVLMVCSSDDAISFLGPVSVSVREMVDVLDPIGTVAELLNCPLHKVVS